MSAEARVEQCTRPGHPTECEIARLQAEVERLNRALAAEQEQCHQLGHKLRHLATALEQARVDTHELVTVLDSVHKAHVGGHTCQAVGPTSSHVCRLLARLSAPPPAGEGKASHVCSYEFLEDGSIGCERCEGIRPAGEEGAR